jgi:hypothetical protein
MDKKLTTIDCLIMLQAAYPRLDLGPQTIQVYQLSLADIEPRLLQAAVLKHISTSKWLPTIADLRQGVTELVLEAEGQLTAPEAWGLVMREVRLVGHWREPTLPASVRQAVEAIGGWRQICFSENITADRARFLEAYSLISKRKAQKLQQMPAVTEAQEALAEGRMKVESAVDGLLAGMNGSGKQSTDNNLPNTENGV